MTRINHNIRSNWRTVALLWLLFFLVLFTRLYRLNSVPPAISHDEIYYPVQAKTLSLNFSDQSNTWNPLTLTAANPLYAELPGLVMAPSAALFSDPIIAARATHVFLGTILVFILAAISFCLTKSKRVFYSTLFVAAFNPWLFQFSRAGFDSLLSLFFYSAATLVLLLTKSWWRLTSIPLLLLGFYQYQGLKVVFLPLLFSILAYIIWDEWSQSLKKTLVVHIPLLMIGLFSLLLFIFYLAGLQTQVSGNRINDLVFNSSQLASKTQTLRNQSINNPFVEIFSNKGTLSAHILLAQYADVFSFKHLFVEGEALRNPFSVWSIGMFYPIGALLIFVGFFTLFRSKKWYKAGWLLLALLIISPIPSAINSTGSWVMFRASLMVPVLVILSGVGLGRILEVKQKGLIVATLMIYLVFVINFLYVYFYRFPIYGTLGNYFAERLVASYISRSANKQILVLADEPFLVFNNLLHFTNSVNKANLPAINLAFQTGNYKLNNLTLKNKCLDLRQLGDDQVIIASSLIPTCDKNINPASIPTSSIPSLLDSGDIFLVYNDDLCLPYGLENFSHVQQNFFAVEQLDDKQFCKSFLINSR